MAPVTWNRAVVRAAAVFSVVGLMVWSAVLPASADDADFEVSGAGAAGLSMSGLTRDNEAGLYWAVRGPASPTVVSIAADGRVVGEVKLTQSVTNVQALSWRNGVLHVGDIGGSRERVVVLAISSPSDGPGRTRTFTLRYPDGAHDAAAMMVSPRGNIYLVTTGASPAFYRPASEPVDGGTVDLRRVADAPEGVTDGTFLSDGQRLALRTPVGIQLYDAFSLQRVAMGPTPDQIVGDSLTEGLGGSNLVVGYGGTAPRVAVMDYPKGNVTSSPKPSAPASSASPAASPAASASSAAPTSAPATAAPSVTKGARGTLISLALAAVVAALAGAVTLIGRRR